MKSPAPAANVHDELASPCLSPCLRNLASKPPLPEESQAIERALQRLLLGSTTAD